MEAGSNNYLAWGSDNIAYGPVELPTLVNWIKLGRVPADSWVYKEKDHAWHRAGDIGELKILFKSKDTSGAASTQANAINPGSLRRIKMLAHVDDRLLASLLSYLEVV